MTVPSFITYYNTQAYKYIPMLKSQKPRNEIEPSVESRFHFLQAQPVHLKMQQVRRILQQNNQLTSVNASLHICLLALFNHAYKKEQGLSQTLKILKSNTNSLERSAYKKLFHPLLTEISRKLESTNEPSPNFARSNKQAISAGAVKNLVDNLSEPQLYLSGSKNPSLTSSTQPRSNDLELSSAHFQRRVNPSQVQTSLQNQRLKARVQEVENANTALKSKITRLGIKLKTICAYHAQIKMQVGQLKLWKGQVKKQLNETLQILKGQMELKQTEFDQKLLEVEQLVEEQKQNKICREILSMKYDENFESMPLSQIQNINEEEPLENVRYKIMRDINLNRVKSLSETLSMLQNLKIKEQISTGVLRRTQPIEKIEQEGSVQNKIVEQVRALVGEIKQLKMQLQYNKLNEKKTYKQIVQAQPALCFLMSNLLPIFSATEESEAITQSQHFILSSLEKYYKHKRKVTSLRYLYGFQRMVELNVNFHCIVDNHPYLLLLVKLKNGVIVGAYCESGLSESTSTAFNRNRGFLFQCRDQTIYNVRSKYPNNSVMPYDPFFVLVGNHDIKIRVGSNLMESCFGFETSLFRPSSQYTADSILFSGNAATVAELLDYQFYEVCFS